MCCPWPAEATAGLEHAEAAVLIVNVAVTALAPETVELDIKKHPFKSAGLPETVHETVPV